MKEIVQKELGREELENFYVMVRSYYPNAVPVGSGSWVR